MPAHPSWPGPAIDSHHHWVGVCIHAKQELRYPRGGLDTLGVGKVGIHLCLWVPQFAVVLEYAVLDQEWNLTGVSRVGGPTRWGVGQPWHLRSRVSGAVGGEELPGEVEASKASCSRWQEAAVHRSKGSHWGTCTSYCASGLGSLVSPTTMNLRHLLSHAVHSNRMHLAYAASTHNSVPLC